MSGISIKREDEAAGGRYVTRVDGLEAEMTFTRAKRGRQDVMVIDHTGVPSQLSGKGVGLALVTRAVEDARVETFRIVPQCSFVRLMFQRHKDWQDVLAS